MKVQCMVCEDEPIIELKEPSNYYEGYIEVCPTCDKHIAEVYCDHRFYGDVLEWSLEDDEYYDSEKDIIYSDYPVKYIDV